MKENRSLKNPLNSWGDVLVPTTGTHGSDISSQRVDELDQASLDFARALGQERGSIIAMDIGGGLGAQTSRFAALDASVIMVDLVGRPELIATLNSKYGNGRVSGLIADVRRLTEKELPPEIHILYCQRTIHYMRNSEAVDVLRLLRSRMTPDARMFLSCACIDSELAEGYPAVNLPVTERFHQLGIDMREKHDIVEPVCLYTKEDFGRLAEDAGFSATQITQSHFGTLKGIFAVRGT